MRDSQRQRVYDAEATVSVRDDIQFADIAECQRYADKVRASRCWARYATRQPPHVKVVHWRGYGGMASFHGDWIKLGWRSMYRRLLLHELAHCGTPGGIRHGWQFCALYLHLVQHFMGWHEMVELKLAFRSQGVKFTEGRRRS